MNDTDTKPLAAESPEVHPPLRSAVLAGLVLALVVVGVSGLDAWLSLIGEHAQMRQYHELRAFGKARETLDTYRQEHGRYPDAMKQPPVDYYKTPVVYRKTPAGYELTTLGRDGQPGGIGVNQDVTVDQNAPEGSCPLHRPYLTPWQALSLTTNSGGIVVAVFGAFFAFGLGFVVIASMAKTWARVVSMIVMLLVTAAVSIVVGFLMALSALPSHH